LAGAALVSRTASVEKENPGRDIVKKIAAEAGVERTSLREDCASLNVLDRHEFDPDNRRVGHPLDLLRGLERALDFGSGRANRFCLVG
jgi:hypothetical protein